MGGDTSDTYGSSKTDDYSSGNTGVSLPLLLLLRFEKPCHVIQSLTQYRAEAMGTMTPQGREVSFLLKSFAFSPSV
jgi:hypothetical protein